MSAATLNAIVQMLESLPDDLQEQLAQYIHQYIQTYMNERKSAKQSKRAAFGILKGSGKILGDVVEPVLPLSTWEVLQ